jgi:hypothetical protein
MKPFATFGLAAVFAASALFAAAPPARAAADQTMPTCAAGDQVVWENTKSGSKVYHLKGDKYFGNTKSGKYACKSAADAAGYHAAAMQGSSASAADASPAPAASPTGSKKKHKHHMSTASPAANAPSPAATAT